MGKLVDVTTVSSGAEHSAEAPKQDGEFDRRGGDAPFRHALAEHLPAHYLVDAEAPPRESVAALAPSR